MRIFSPRTTDTDRRFEGGVGLVQVNVMQVGELSARNCSYLQNDRVLRVEPRRQLEALLSRAAHHRQAFRKYCALSSAAALERDEFSGSLSSLAKGLFSGGEGIGLGGVASASLA
jgi:hypothetical protein